MVFTKPPPLPPLVDDRSEPPRTRFDHRKLHISSSSSAHGLPGRFASCVLDLLVRRPPAHAGLGTDHLDAAGPGQDRVPVPAGLLRRRRELRRSAQGVHDVLRFRPTIARRSPATSATRRRSSSTMPQARIAISTPEVELPFAGHPCVGTARLLLGEGIALDALRPPAGTVPVRGDGELTWVAARPEWCPAWELVEYGSAAEVDAPAGPHRGLPLRLGVDRRARRPRPRPLLRPRGRRRRGRGDRLGGAAALRPARPPDRGPPGARLGDPRPPPRRRDGRDRRAGGGGLKVPGDRPTNPCPRRGSNSRPTD